MKTPRHLTAGVCAALCFALCGTLNAEPAAYSDQHAFRAALPSVARVLTFDDLPPGTTIEDAATAGGITFSYRFEEGLAMKVAHLYATTSAPNFLGTADGGMFHDGDDFTLTFEPGSAIGLFFISADPLVDGDIKMTAGGLTAKLAAKQVQDTLPDGSRVYFLGVVNADESISEAHVEALAGGFFLYNVDDIITAPHSPASVASNPQDLTSESF